MLVEFFVGLFDDSLTTEEFFIVLVVADEVGEIAVGEAHEDHVAIVVGLRSVALTVEDAVEHVECLDHFVIGGIVVGETKVALERPWGVAYAVVEDIACVEE